MEEEQLEIIGARAHNLKDISLTIPRNKLVVLTGLSGSGKSSLAFDTIMLKDSGVTSKVFRVMPGNFWVIWNALMLIKFQA